MNIREMKIEEINPAEYNPRVELRPGSKDFEKLKRSIEEFGLVDPLIVNEQTGNLVGGHQRLAVLKHLGFTTAPVVIVDIDLEREKALNLSLNRNMGDWDLNKLASLVDSMDNELVMIGGFEDGEVQEMMRMDHLERSTDFLSDFVTGPDDDPATPREPRTMAPGGSEFKEDHPHRTGQQYFEVQLVLTGEQRDKYYEAVKIAKKVYALDNSMDAVTQIFDYYVQEHLQEA